MLGHYTPDLVPITGRRGSLVAIWHGFVSHRSVTSTTNHERLALLGGFAASHLLEMCVEENRLEIIDREKIEIMTPTLRQLICAEHGFKEGTTARGIN